MQITHCESKRFIVPSIALLAFIALACHSSTSPQPAQVEDLTWHVPGTGSLYVETHFRGTEMYGLQDSRDAHYWVQSIGSFAGKINAIKLDSIEEYIAFESNGDYSVLDSSWGLSPADWQRFPTGQGSPIVQTRDTTFAPDSILYFDTTHVYKLATRSFVDVENITDSDKISYATFKIHEVSTEVDSVISFQHPSNPQVITMNTDYWIAPTIGWIVKDSSSDDSSWTRKQLNGCTVY